MPHAQAANSSDRRRKPVPPRYMQVNLQRLDDGRVRLSTPQARGAGYAVKGPMQLWHALQALWRDATEAGQAAWRGERTQLDWLTDPDDPTEPGRRALPEPGDVAKARAVGYSYRAVVRPDQADPATWVPLPPEHPDGPDGREVRPWRSPNGRRWTSAKVLGPLLAKRDLLGLPTTYEAHVAARTDEVSA